VGLGLADFRAEERTFALLVQLAGRAGREGSGGRVLLQSWTPESRVVRLAARHAVDEFLDGEIARRAVFGYPPHGRLVRLLVTAPGAGAPERIIGALAERVRPALRGDDVLGPAGLFRVRRQERAHLLVRTGSARRAAVVLRDAVRDAGPDLRRANATAVVDVDPQALV
jgi:primosomal protein N' (replication factor Y)